MADLFVSALIPIVIQKLADLMVQKMGKMWGIDVQCKRLHDKLLAVQAILTDAEEQGEAKPSVKSWLAKLKLAVYNVDHILDEFHYHRHAVRCGHKFGNVSGFFSLENPVLFWFTKSRKLKEAVGRIDELVNEMERFKFVQRRQGRVVDSDRTTHSYVSESEVVGRGDDEVVGRGDDKDKLLKLLTEVSPTDNLTILPIVGTGGIGKTTLAQLVYNHPRVKEYFNLSLWVCVSENFSVGDIVKSIINLVKGNCNLYIDNMEMLQRHLREVLSGKRYLLVLDDVWNESDDQWEELRALLNYGDSGSVVLVTTRSDKVATIMGTIESFNLGWLGEEDSWNLFHKRAFGKGVKECLVLVEIGRKLVQNCGGFPLAIKTLGSLMSYKSEVREWLDVLDESIIWDNVLPVLRLSYDHLPSYMKQCFAFCAVYPKNYVMDKDKLIQFWMAHGFIPSDESSSLEMKGNDIFNELVSRSFFRKVWHVCPISSSWRIDSVQTSSHLDQGYRSQTKCIMHDLMHDLAQSIMRDNCLSIESIPPGVPETNINVHHVSLETLPSDINTVKYCFPSIQSLISSYPYGQRSSASSYYMENIGFLNSNSLRILELGTRLHKKTILTPEKMKHLRYLELSIRDITSLPESITTLYLLQTLRLSKCWSLEKLPEGMRYMSNLRHLYISKHCHNLKNMPEGFRQLKCLQTLTAYIVGTDAGNGIEELNELNNLHGQLHLYNLRKIKDVVDARKANLIAKQNLDDLMLCWGMPIDLMLCWGMPIDCQGFDPIIPELNAPEVMHCDPFEVFDALKPHNKLKVLKVTLYRGDKLPLWVKEYQMLENLIELYIIRCRECTEIPPVEKLPFLQILKLKSLDNLRHLCNSASVGAECSEDARVTFPSLKKMVLYNMPKLCSWYEGEVGNKSSLIFPVLKRLKVTNCPKLTAMPIVLSLCDF